ncbi:BadF/BadG/BcrA/BcrD ATPase family protein [Paraglaciecola aquimarina]|uniref:BadF/BadG/BcrA/BcrD ATPase family protein n=1 Tax=Paraglaciecola aquimarina TaxID=1235557 RepID=A0ABU3SY83_9ALTE|nr:BadF/BadG/BcrA/BcrD ATPase family protein [Paraglaciecola aquimarina]MDU0354961.1 BadF/BadG/BcrA/BcrD ATPase family protein [Paraglaciecola aquimarina]
MGKQAKFYIGIDGGGTKCKARLENANGQLLAEAIAGQANAALDLTGTVQSIIQASEQAIKQANIADLSINQLNAGIGLAGLNIPEVKQAFQALTLPFADYHVTTDLHIACLGAHQSDKGAIVIIGTGSSGVVINGDQHVELGGHGFVAGDKGSGAWLGKQAVSFCLETLDGLHPLNPLSDAVLAELHCQSALQLANLTLNAKPAFFATLAPTLFMQAKDQQPEAIAIIAQAADYINRLSTKLLSFNTPRLSFIGGITDALIPYLAPDIQTSIQPALASPEQGAILFSKLTSK